MMEDWKPDLSEVYCLSIKINKRLSNWEQSQAWIITERIKLVRDVMVSCL